MSDITIAGSSPCTKKTKAVPMALPRAIRGILAGRAETGEPLVDFLRNPLGKPLIAISTVRVDQNDLGKEAILVFEDGDVSRPILIGLLQRPVPDEVPPKRAAILDGDQLTFTANREIVLRCGKASITLTRAGKVVIRGAYLSNHSSGVNRIKGASVQIN